MPPTRKLSTLEINTISADSNHTGVTSFCGFGVRETGSAAAVVNFRIGSVTGDIIAPLALAADESATISYGNTVSTPTGVYVQVVSGAIAGSLYSAK